MFFDLELWNHIALVETVEVDCFTVSTTQRVKNCHEICVSMIDT